MSQWKSYREEFYKEAIATGLSSLEELTRLYPLGTTVPSSRLKVWLNRLRKPMVVEPWRQQYRTVNHFKIGADPEFVFVNVMTLREMYDNEMLSRPDYPEDKVPIEQRAKRVSAQDLGLHQGPAFGADNNGRLAEIRPYAHRSALEVVASVATTLRWMVSVAPKTRNLQWWSGAFLLGDGIGGHVHFGRKVHRLPPANGYLTPEIQALDVLNMLLVELGMFPRDEVLRRQEGDGHGQRYGRPGDFRKQLHGYEYRTFPSWLDSPEMAFIVLTLAKLAVHSPEFFLNNRRPATSKGYLGMLENLLAYYKGRDDDARLAYWILATRGLPRISRNRDFRTRWGITKEFFVELARADKGVQIVPLAIKPTVDEVREMHKALLMGVTYQQRMLPPTWAAYQVPPTTQSMLSQYQTVGVKGFGELIYDLVNYGNFTLSLDKFPATRRGSQLPSIKVSPDLARKFPANWKLLIAKEIKSFRVELAEGANAIVYVPQGLIQETPKQVRKFLTMGWLPIWTAQGATPDALAAYAALKETIKSKFPKKSVVLWKYPLKKGEQNPG